MLNIVMVPAFIILNTFSLIQFISTTTIMKTWTTQTRLEYFPRDTALIFTFLKACDRTTDGKFRDELKITYGCSSTPNTYGKRALVSKQKILVKQINEHF